MRRLYAQIYLALLGVIVVSVIVIGLAAHLTHDRDTVPTFLRVALENTMRDLPARAGDLEAELLRRARNLHLELTLRDAEGHVLTSTRPALPPPPLDARDGEDWFRFRGQPGMHLRLDNGRWVTALAHGPRHKRPVRFLVGLALFALVVGACAYPLARRIARRLERLDGDVERWGAGALDTRTPVEGSDEVASLARRFNDAAERIQALVDQQRRVLAHTSHELRTPLARLRLAFELLEEDTRTADERARLRQGVLSDLDELDALIGDLLTASRLETADQALRHERVDLGALAAQEAARVGAVAQGTGAWVSGDATLLRRMLRNLLENAQRHGRGAAITTRVELTGDAARLEVGDAGPGIPEGERARIFEPFYRRGGHSEGEHGGVGLGLSLVRQIARAHGGDVTYAPRDGGGSVFVVTLPRGDRAA